MRIIVIFDLPTTTPSDRREYIKFRKYLTKSGFAMVQFSVYSKLVQNTTVAEGVMENIKKNKPVAGLAQMILLTEKQYSRMEFVVGEKRSSIVDSDERLIVL